MPLLRTLIPEQASNDYRGGRVPFVAFLLLVALVTFRTSVHLFTQDSGVNSIATIHQFAGEPDPDRVIYMYSALWGSQQAIMVLVYGIVLLRYRNLIPLMFGLMAVEVTFRMLVGALHPLGEEFYARRPPGAVMNLPLLVVCLLMIALAHRRTASCTTS